MKTSARNQLAGTVTEVKIEGLVAQIKLKVGDSQVTALITADSAREMGLKVGDKATAVVKATSVMIMK